jgi:hypothetical protein
MYVHVCAGRMPARHFSSLRPPENGSALFHPVALTHARTQIKKVAPGSTHQGCQMVYFFRPKNPTLGKIWRALERKMLLNVFYDHSEHFSLIWYNLWPFGIVCGHLAYRYIFPVLVFFGPRKIWQPCRALREKIFLHSNDSEK